MKTNIIFTTILFTMVSIPIAYASTESATIPTAPITGSSSSPTPSPSPSTSSSPSPSPTPNVDTLAPPSVETVRQNPWQSTSVDPAPNDNTSNPSSQDEPEAWAVVDSNGNTLNVIVCDRDYCGSGWIPTRYEGFTPVEFARVVLQGSRNPQTGNYNGGHSGNYNFNLNVWTQTNSDGSVYEIPIEHGARPICIENCPTPSPTPTPSPSESENSETSVVESSSNTIVQERSISVKPAIVNNSVVINKKLNDKVFRNEILIIATKGNSKKVWTQQVNGKIVNVKIPRKYLFWNISIRYVVG